MKEEEFKKLQDWVSELERLRYPYIFKDGNHQTCLWDGMPETSPGSGMKIGNLSCPCPKCSPRC